MHPIYDGHSEIFEIKKIKIELSSRYDIYDSGEHAAVKRDADHTHNPSYAYLCWLDCVYPFAVRKRI
jgi:hypothetical protein